MRRSMQSRWLLTALTLLTVFFALGGYLAVLSYRWVYDLPNRIAISEEEFGPVMIATTEIALREGPKAGRLNTIKAVAGVGADAVPFLPALEELASDPDPEISAAASNAITRIENAAKLKP